MDPLWDDFPFSASLGGFSGTWKSSSPLTKVQKGFFSPRFPMFPSSRFFVVFRGCVKLSEKSVHKTAIRNWNGWLFVTEKTWCFFSPWRCWVQKKNVSNRFMIKLDPHTKIQGNSLVERMYHPKSLKHPTFFIAWDLGARGFWVPKNYLWKLRASFLPWSPTARCWVYAGGIIWGIFKQINKQIVLVRI